MFSNLRSRLSAGILPRFQSPDQVEGERLLEEGDYAAAELRLAQALLESEKKRFETHRRIHLRLELSEVQRRQFQSEDGTTHPEKLAAAEETVRSALELATRTADHQAQVQCLDALGAVLADQGRCEEHEQVVRDAERVEALLSHPDQIWRALRLKRLGAVRRQSGRVSDAAMAWEEAVTVHERFHGPEHLETAHQLTELGDVYRFLGQHAKAQKCLYRAMRIHERECGINSTEAVHDLTLLTDAFEASGDLDAAAAQQERVLGLKLRVVGADLDEIAEAQTALAELYIKWNNLSRARELLMEAIGTFKRKKGARLAAAYETLASVEERSGRFPDALRELARAGAVWETVHSEHSVELVRNLEYRVQLMERMKLFGDAAFLREKLAAVSQQGTWAAAS